jgi:hypothetical protein
MPCRRPFLSPEFKFAEDDFPQLAQEIGIALAGASKVDDLVGYCSPDTLVTVANPTEGDADHLEGDAMDPPGFAIELLAIR